MPSINLFLAGELIKLIVSLRFCICLQKTEQVKLYQEREFMSWYRYESDALILKLYIQPGAKRNEMIGLVQEELKIKLATPALE